MEWFVSADPHRHRQRCSQCPENLSRFASPQEFHIEALLLLRWITACYDVTMAHHPSHFSVKLCVTPVSRDHAAWQCDPRGGHGTTEAAPPPPALGVARLETPAAAPCSPAPHTRTHGTMVREVFTITEKAPIWAFSLLKVPTLLLSHLQIY